MQADIPDEMKNKLAQYQTLQQQLQMVAMQKQQLMVDKAEAESAKKGLEDSKGEVYKSIGPLLIKSEKKSIEAELQDSLESSEQRIKMLEGQEKKLSTKAEELGKELQAGLSGGSGNSGA